MFQAFLNIHQAFLRCLRARKAKLTSRQRQHFAHRDLCARTAGEFFTHAGKRLYCRFAILLIIASPAHVKEIVERGIKYISSVQ